MVKNFGVAVILFTLIVKVASFPLNLKQQKNMAFSQLFLPKVQEIQRKYKNNQPKLQEEMAKLQKEGYNPMGGCGPMIVIMVILFGVIDVVYKPMTHLEHLDKDSIAAIEGVAMETEYASIILGSPKDTELILEYVNSSNDSSALTISETLPQIVIGEGETYAAKTGLTADERQLYGGAVVNNPTVFDNKNLKNLRLSKQVKDELSRAAVKYGGLQGEIYSLQVYKNSPNAFNTAKINSENLDILNRLQKNMIFLGLDLSQTPKVAFEPLIVIPILAFAFSMLQMLLAQKIQEKNNVGGPSQPGAKAMLYITPFFSLFISFSVPAGAGLYWGISYVFGIVQSLITQKFWPNDKLREQARLANEEKIQTVAKVVEVDDQGNETVKIESISEMSAKDQKEYFRKKLEDARREDALKYGEEAPAEDDDK
ncbi:MAG: YidC/Oxa1 family membrane protein insertase [Eubacterium sp.]|nr:YidC/Oxa1 family membrane protein insertase [Eubacterium sp.]